LPTHTGSCTQWGIYDEYIKDLERQKVEETMKSKGGKKQGTAAAQQPVVVKTQEFVPPMQSPDMSKAVHIVDRMVNQNMFEEIAMDFKYWEDASDTYR
jgi:dynein intermediate chain 1